MQWDFWSLNPESLHQITILFSDRGLPASYRHMNGYGSHTLSFVNAAGERFWCKFHFKTRQGIKNLTGEESANLIGIDRESHQRDLTAQAIAGALSGARQDIQMRQLCHFFRADMDYGRRVAVALNIEIDPGMVQQNQQNNPQPVTA